MSSEVDVHDNELSEVLVDQNSKPLSKPKRPLILTKRDYEIFHYLLDQKFLSLRQIYFRFFDVRKNPKDPLPNGFHVTRQRLQALIRHGFITKEKVYRDASSVYLLTNFGFRALRFEKPNACYSKPVTSVDFRSYEHDLKATNCRIALERSGRAIRWVSEREIRMFGFRSDNSKIVLPKEIVPDGVFITAKGSRVAFEIEASLRKKERFIHKFKAYRDTMWMQNPLFHRVIWVTTTDPLKKMIHAVCGNDESFIRDSYAVYVSSFDPEFKPDSNGNGSNK